MNELTWQAATAANILEARKKKGKVVAKKSRSGCTTCKARRVKCDETYPHCRKCVRGGRQCAGYDSSPDTTNAHAKSSRSLIGQRLSQTLGLRDHETRTFDYFLSWSAPRLAGPLDKDFWCGQVLQVAQSEPIVLDALLAISVLYEHPQFMKSFYPPTAPQDAADSQSQSDISKKRNGIVQSLHPAISRPPIDSYHAEALMHYNRAIQRFKERMEEGTATPLLALLTCALFVCIELIRDDVFAALVLFTQGAKLLSDFQPPDGTGDSLYVTLKLMFARMALLTSLTGHSERVQTPEDYARIDDKSGFESMHHARASLFGLTTDASDCIRDASEYATGPNAHYPRTNYVDDFPSEAERLQDVATRSPSVTHMYTGCFNNKEPAPLLPKNDYITTQQNPNSQPPMQAPHVGICERQSSLQNQLDRWLRAFNLSSFAHREDEAVANLLMHFHVFKIWLSACLSPFESVFDAFGSEFAEILRLAEIFTTCKAERPTYVSNFDSLFDSLIIQARKLGETDSFDLKGVEESWSRIADVLTVQTIETGVVPHLYYVATKCRVPSLRRKAIGLMHKAPLKEAHYGSASTAEIVSRIVTIEEEGIHPPLAPLVSGCSSLELPVDDSILPEESKRVQNLEILMNKPANRFEIRVTRHSYDVTTRERIKSVQDYPV